MQNFLAFEIRSITAYSDMYTMGLRKSEESTCFIQICLHIVRLAGTSGFCSSSIVRWATRFICTSRSSTPENIETTACGYQCQLSKPPKTEPHTAGKVLQCVLIASPCYQQTKCSWGRRPSTLFRPASDLYSSLSCCILDTYQWLVKHIWAHLSPCAPLTTSFNIKWTYIFSWWSHEVITF